MNKLKGQKIVSCRICKGDHWTTRCPYKDTLGPMQKELAEQLGLSTGEKEKLPGGARAWDAAWQAVGWGGLCAPLGETLVFACCDWSCPRREVVISHVGTSPARLWLWPGLCESVRPAGLVL